MSAAQQPSQVIDLLSDDEDYYFDHAELPNDPEVLLPFQRDGMDMDEDWGNYYADFDLDAAAPPDAREVEDNLDQDAIDLAHRGNNGHASPEPADHAQEENIDNDVDIAPKELVTAAACLQMVADIFPDISVDHVLQLIADQTQDATRTPEACQRIITILLDGGAYPKEDEEVSRKRKREHSVSEFEDDNGEGRSQTYKDDAVDLLKDEFVHVPVRHIERVIKEHKTFYKAYGIIEEQLRNYSRPQSPFTKIHKARLRRGAEIVLVGRGSQIPKELHAAKKKCEEAATKRRKAEDALREEDDNIRQAVLAGEMTECQCCFDEFPLNRTITCDGDTTHFLCRECVKNYVESEMGSSKCRPVCFADSTCGGSFTRSQLQDCLTDIAFDRLEHMQQMQDLEIAGLDLDECPFCDFKQECPPVDEDREFRCLNPKCRQTSCRLCHKKTHVPLSCEEAKKDEGLTIRHIVEEAMTAALVRNCNKCKRPFIKDYGCNKMSCSHCGNRQCYVCSKDISDYGHFSDHNANGKGCALHDNVENRHEREVKKAADEAMAKAKADHPELSDADLMIQVSDRVKQAEQQRLGRAQAVHQGFNYHMAGGRLIAGAPPGNAPAMPAPPAPAAAFPQYVPPMPPLNHPPALVPHQQVLLHHQRMLRQPHHNLAPPPLLYMPANRVPAHVPQLGVVPLQHPQAPQPGQHIHAANLLDFAHAQIGNLQELFRVQRARPAAQPRAQNPEPAEQMGVHRPVLPGYIPLPGRLQRVRDQQHALPSDLAGAEAAIAHRARSIQEQLDGRLRAQRPAPAGQRN